MDTKSRAKDRAIWRQTVEALEGEAEGVKETWDIRITINKRKYTIKFKRMMGTKYSFILCYFYYIICNLLLLYYFL